MKTYPGAAPEKGFNSVLFRRGNVTYAPGKLRFLDLRFNSVLFRRGNVTTGIPTARDQKVRFNSVLFRRGNVTTLPRSG